MTPDQEPSQPGEQKVDTEGKTDPQKQGDVDLQDPAVFRHEVRNTLYTIGLATALLSKAVEKGEAPDHNRIAHANQIIRRATDHIADLVHRSLQECRNV